MTDNNNVFTNVVVATTLTAAACFIGYNIFSLVGSSGGKKGGNGDSGGLSWDDAKPGATSSGSNAKFPVFKKPSSSSSSSSSSSVVKDGNKDSSMKGYKTTSDGRTTSYFTREISDADRLILEQANTGPQRIDSSGGAAPSSPMRVSLDCSGGSKGGSEWNSAGTFEEKDVSDWARRRLQALLAGLAVRGAGGTNLNVFIDDAKLAEGDASVVYTRGKCKYIYDLCVDVCFIMTPEQELDDRLNLTSRIDGKSTRGKIRINDITADEEQEVAITEVTGRDCDRRAGGHFRTCVGESLRDTQHTLLRAIGQALGTFLQDMKRQYEKSS